jgi:hypothetical protein
MPPTSPFDSASAAVCDPCASDTRHRHHCVLRRRRVDENAGAAAVAADCPLLTLRDCRVPRMLLCCCACCGDGRLVGVQAPPEPWFQGRETYDFRAGRRIIRKEDLMGAPEWSVAQRLCVLVWLYSIRYAHDVVVMCVMSCESTLICVRAGGRAASRAIQCTSHACHSAPSVLMLCFAGAHCHARLSDRA